MCDIKQKLETINNYFIQPGVNFCKNTIKPALLFILKKIAQLMKIIFITGFTLAHYYASPFFAFTGLVFGVIAPQLVFKAQENLKRVWNGVVWKGNPQHMQNATNQDKTANKTSKWWILNRAMIVAGLTIFYLANWVQACTVISFFWFSSLGAKFHHAADKHFNNHSSQQNGLTAVQN